MTIKKNKLQEIVFTAVGHASTCWIGGTGNATFNEKEATKCAESLIKDIEKLYATKEKDS